MDTDPSRAPLFKRIDNPWIGLLVLGIFIFASSIIALIVLCCFWRRHQQRTKLYNDSFILSNRPTGRQPYDDEPSTSHEIQKVKAFVAAIDEERLPARLTSPEDIQRVHQFYERTTKAYF